MVRVPSPTHGFIEFDIEIVELDLPMLVGLRKLREKQILNNITTNVLRHEDLGWSDAIKEKHGHLFWNSRTHITLKLSLGGHTYTFFTRLRKNCTT